MIGLCLAFPSFVLTLASILSLDSEICSCRISAVFAGGNGDCLLQSVYIPKALETISNRGVDPRNSCFNAGRF